MFGSSNRTIIQTQTSKTTQKWVTEHKTKLLLWPFQSSDLNLLFILFYFIFFFIFFILLLPIFIYILLCYVSFFIFLHCPLSGPVLTYISLLIIPCMIVYVTNNKEPWTLNPVENEWGELKRSTVMELWIWRIWRDSGWRNGLWSLVRCSLTSSGIIGENLELLNWQMEVSKSIE